VDTPQSGGAADGHFGFIAVVQKSSGRMYASGQGCVKTPEASLRAQRQNRRGELEDAMHALCPTNAAAMDGGGRALNEAGRRAESDILKLVKFAAKRNLYKPGMRRVVGQINGTTPAEGKGA